MLLPVICLWKINVIIIIIFKKTNFFTTRLCPLLYLFLRGCNLFGKIYYTIGGILPIVERFFAVVHMANTQIGSFGIQLKS